MVSSSNFTDENFSDYYDYLTLFDEGFLTVSEFLLYNKYIQQFPNLTDEEIFSIINSNEMEN